MSVSDKKEYLNFFTKFENLNYLVIFFRIFFEFHRTEIKT